MSKKGTFKGTHNKSKKKKILLKIAKGIYKFSFPEKLFFCYDFHRPIPRCVSSSKIRLNHFDESPITSSKKQLNHFVISPISSSKITLSKITSKIRLIDF
jgi:hypothetical protein